MATAEVYSFFHLRKRGSLLPRRQVWDQIGGLQAFIKAG